MSEFQHKNWFENWFDSKYYHLLYKNRDCAEAESFIDHLINFLKPKKNAKILDMPCGKGRHSVYLNKQGFDVVGVDLSAESISCAKKFENNKLVFNRHDMRNVLENNCFDIVLNLFTSMAYFENIEDNYKVISAVHQSLKFDGIFIIDFLNAQKVSESLVREERKTIDNVEFCISKTIENNFVVKKIAFCDQAKEYLFYEKVMLLKLNDFKTFLTKAGFKITHLFGDYSLNPFNEHTSDRLIIVSQKL